MTYRWQTRYVVRINRAWAESVSSEPFCIFTQHFTYSTIFNVIKRRADIRKSENPNQTKYLCNSLLILVIPVHVHQSYCCNHWSFAYSYFLCNIQNHKHASSVRIRQHKINYTIIMTCFKHWRTWQKQICGRFCTSADGWFFQFFKSCSVANKHHQPTYTITKNGPINYAMHCSCYICIYYKFQQ